MKTQANQTDISPNPGESPVEQVAVVGKASFFWPVAILGISLLIVLTSSVVGAMQQWFAGVRLRDQQSTLSSQAVQAETKMRILLMDLIELAKTNKDAEAIIKKYGIVFSAPATNATPVATSAAP